MQYSSDLATYSSYIFKRNTDQFWEQYAFTLCDLDFFLFLFCSFFFFVLYLLLSSFSTSLSLYSVFVFWVFISLLFLHHSILFCKDRFRSDVCLFQNYLSSWYWKIWTIWFEKSLQSSRKWALIGPNVM